MLDTAKWGPSKCSALAGGYGGVGKPAFPGLQNDYKWITIGLQGRYRGGGYLGGESIDRPISAVFCPPRCVTSSVLTPGLLYCSDRSGAGQEHCPSCFGFLVGLSDRSIGDSTLHPTDGNPVGRRPSAGALG